METKMDLYAAHGGKADASSTSGGHGDGGFGGRKGKLGVVEGSPQLDSAMTIVEKKS